jgi:hypothetical protein
MAGADKFGNIYFVRLPQDVSDEIEEDPTGGRIKWEQGKLNGAPNKVEEIVQFHVGDLISSLQKASLIPGGGECILYGTIMGSIGALHAFTSRDDVDFFSHLEMHMRQDNPPLCGRDHMAYRSAYFPVKVYLIYITLLILSVIITMYCLSSILDKSFLPVILSWLGLPRTFYPIPLMKIPTCPNVSFCVTSAVVLNF